MNQNHEYLTPFDVPAGSDFTIQNLPPISAITYDDIEEGDLIHVMTASKSVLFNVAGYAYKRRVCGIEDGKEITSWETYDGEVIIYSDDEDYRLFRVNTPQEEEIPTTEVSQS